MTIPGFPTRFSALIGRDPRVDLHIHSLWSDGLDLIVEIAAAARQKGLKAIAITDHVREQSTYFREYCGEIKRVESVDLPICIGFEAKIRDFQGNLDVSLETRRLSKIQIGSVHRFPIGRKLINPKDFSGRICQEIELELSIAAIRSQSMSILGHPGGMSLSSFGEFPQEYFREIVAECTRADVSFELNSAYHMGVYADLLPILREYDPFVSYGSDAHTLGDIGKCLAFSGTGDFR
jgi:putative hydrolase